MDEVGHLREGLKSDDGRVRAGALEALLLQAIEDEHARPEGSEARGGADAVVLDTGSVRRLGAVYRRMSERVLKQSQREGCRTGDEEVGDRADRDLIWGMVFGARSFHVAHRLLPRILRPGVERVVDIGGGWGPFALCAALRGYPVLVVDVAAERLELSKRLFSRMGLEAEWRLGEWSTSWTKNHDLSVWSFSLREMTTSIAAGAALLQRARRAAGPLGCELVLESGAKPGSAFVMGLRDAVVGSGLPVEQPCRASAGCPMKAAGDWCHFTWRTALGPLGQRIASSAGRRSSEIHFSWMALNAPRPAAANAAVVLDRRDLRKQGWRLTLCSPQGLRRVDVPRRLQRALPDLAGDVGGRLALIPGDGDHRMRAETDWHWVDSAVSHGTSRL